MGGTISDFIRRDLASRLGSGGDLPLTLHALSRHYGVSLTPVRVAVRSLLHAGLLMKEPDGRLRPNPDAAPRSEPPPTEPARPVDLDAALLADVIRLSLQGEADYLREEATARRLGVGRTAIRQALHRLAGRGLIDHVARCGWRVRPIDLTDLSAFLEVREVLERKALDLARPHLIDADLRRMLRGNVAGGRLDNELHRYLVAKAGNAYISDFFDRHGVFYAALLDFAAPETHVVEAMARQHRAILRALLARDWPRARRALARHIRAQRPIVAELIRNLGS